MFFSSRVPPKARYAYSHDAWAGIFCAVMSGLTFPFIGIIACKRLGASEFQLGVIIAASVGTNLLSFIWANTMEGRRKMPFVTWPWMAGMVLLALVFFARTAWSFVCVISIFYLLLSVNALAYSAIMKEVYPDEDRGRIMAYVRVGSSFTATIVLLFAGKLMDTIGYIFVFPMAAVFGVISGYSFNRIPAHETKGDPNMGFKEFLRNSILILHEDKAYRWFCAAIFIFGAANLMATPIIISFQVKVLHVTYYWTALYSLVISVLTMVAYFCWGSYVDREPADKVVAICAVLTGLNVLTFCFITKAWMIVPTCVTGGIAAAGLDLSYMMGVMRYAPHERVTHYQALFAALIGVRGVVAPFIGPILVKSHLLGPRGVFAVASVMIFIAAFIQMAGLRRHKPLANAGV